MVNKLLIPAAIICQAAAHAADFSAMPLPQQSIASLQKTAAAAVKDGAWKEWTDWLGKLLSAELTRSSLQPSPAAFAKFISQPQAALALAQWRLLTATGPDNFKAVAEKDGTAFLTWLFSNQAALNIYLGSGPLDAEQNPRGLEVWRDIYRSDAESRDGLWLRVAAATALAHTVPVKSLADGGEIDPQKRYQYYRNARSSGLLSPGFDKSATWELRFVVNSWAREEEMAWVLNAMDPKHKSQEKIGEACWMVPYRLHNSKGVSVQNGPEYYDHQPVTLKLMHEVGGVCGAISKFGTAAAQAYGVPAMPVGQPGHCAFLWKKDAQTWRTGNDIEGWAGSTEHGGIFIHWGNRGSYVMLIEEAHRDAGKFLASEQAVWSASLAGGNSPALLQTAVKIQPLNAGAWQALTQTLSAAKDTPAVVWQNAAHDLMQSLTDHPQPMVELLTPIESKLDLADAGKRRQYVAGVSAAIARGSKETQHNTAQAALADLVRRHAAALVPGGDRTLQAMLDPKKDTAAAKVTDADRAAVLSIVEAAVEAGKGRGDLQDALTGRYLALMQSNPASLARAIKFFGSLFETAKTNPDRKPAIALARRLILLSAKAGDLASMEKYSAECRRLLQ
jgi:hypothetical protein